MPTVEVQIAGRRHQLQCDAGEEVRLKRLAAYLDSKASDLVRRNPQVGEPQLLLLACLTLADELFDVHDELQQLKTRLGAEARGGEEDAARVLERVAERLDALAEALAKP